MYNKYVIKIKVKPLSLNQAYYGRRFATEELIGFKELVWYELPNIKIPTGKLKAKYVFGVSTKNCDGDNCIKAFQDILATKYGFNDKIIYKWDVEKIDVEKGAEFIEFELTAI